MEHSTATYDEAILLSGWVRLSGNGHVDITKWLASVVPLPDRSRSTNPSCQPVDFFDDQRLIVFRCVGVFEQAFESCAVDVV